MEWKNIVDLADNFGVLVLSLYIIQFGMAQMKELVQQNNTFFKDILDDQKAYNDKLADLLEKICVK